MSDSYDYYWYKAPKNDVHRRVFSYMGVLDNRQAYKQQDNLRYMRLYGNMEFSGIQAYNYMRTEPTYNVQNRVTLNIVQSMIDTVVSKITKNKPKPQFLTDGAEWGLQRRAEKLTQFAEGQFYGTKFYEKASWAFKDACIFGTGCLKIFRSGDSIKVERVFIDEIKTDDTECYYGEPRQIHQTKWVHKDVLIAKFPSFKMEIEAAGHQTPTSMDYKSHDGDMRLVIESWRLRSGENTKDGRHTMAISNATFIDEAYAKDYFPFLFFRWNRKPIGFFGQGIAEQLTGLQLEINKVLRTIQISMHLVSVPKIFVEASSKIVSSHLNNKIGGIVKYVGQPPTEGQLGSVPPELFSHVDRLYQRAFEIVGVSQLSAQAQKPMGLNSGKALRTYNDLETERFMETATLFQDTVLEGSKIMIDIGREIAADTNNYQVSVPGSGFLKTIKWADVDLEEDKFLLQCYPVSALSDSPASRLQEVQELLQAGFIDKDYGVKLLDYPDLKGFYNTENAGIDDIERQIDLMVDSGQYETPEPYQNLQYGIKLMQKNYLKFKAQNCPEDRLELLRRWIEDANAMLVQSQQAVQQEALNQQAMAQNVAQGPLAAGGQNPQLGQAAQPPTTDLLPNAG